MLRKMYEPMKGEITKDLRKLQNDEFQSIYYTLLNIVRVIKWGRLRQTRG
jgi:hypothetical protein